MNSELGDRLLPAPISRSSLELDGFLHSLDGQEDPEANDRVCVAYLWPKTTLLRLLRQILLKRHDFP